MPVTLPLEVYEVLERRFGKEDARVVVKSLESVIGNEVINKWHQTKEELKNEILKEVATKADLENLRLELIGIMKQDKTELLGIMKQDKAELLGIMKQDKAELLGIMKQDKAELLGIMKQDKAELLGKIDALYEKTEKDKAELLGKIDALYEKTEKDKAELLGKIDALYEKTEKDKAELLGIIGQNKTDLEGKLAKLNQKFNFMIILLIIALTLMNPVVAEIIKGLLKI